MYKLTRRGGQLAVQGPHVAFHDIFSGPWKHSGKIFKSESFLESKVTFVSLNTLCWIIRICKITIIMKNFFCAAPMFLFYFIYYTIKLGSMTLR